MLGPFAKTLFRCSFAISVISSALSSGLKPTWASSTTGPGCAASASSCPIGSCTGTCATGLSYGGACGCATDTLFGGCKCD